MTSPQNATQLFDFHENATDTGSMNETKTCKLLLCLGFWLAGLVLSGCGTSGSNGTLQVNVMYPFAGLGDRSFADMVYAGIVQAGTEVDLTEEQGVPSDVDNAKQIFKAWTATPAKSPDLIILVGFNYAQLVAESLCDFGGSDVVLLDSSVSECPHLAYYVYRTFSPSFLAGVASMQVSQRHTAAVIGGMSAATVNEFVRGFQAGVEYAGGTITAVEYLSDTEAGFSDPDKAAEVANRLYESADVIFPVAGGSGQGVFTVAGEAEGRYVIGVDSDQSWINRGVVIGSVVKGLDASVVESVLAVDSQKFVAGGHVLGMAEGGTDFLINDVFADRVQDAVEGARESALTAGAADMQANP